jgi:hypothetical protein
MACDLALIATTLNVIKLRGAQRANRVRLQALGGRFDARSAAIISIASPAG